MMWHSDSYTDKGQIRRINEDAILDLSEQRLWLVADGMGGHSHGDYASQLVTRTLLNFAASPFSGISKRRLIEALDDCNTQLLLKAEREQVDVIGCTVALLQARCNSVICSWSGDSRIYRLRNGQLRQLSRDHTQQSAVEDRDHLRHPISLMEPSQMLTHAIGGSPLLELEHCWFKLIDGDAFLLCTDGLNKEVSDEEIHDAMTKASDGNKVLADLACLYQARGARDNVGMIWVAKAAFPQLIA